jgi:hypothetical protein
VAVDDELIRRKPHVEEETAVQIPSSDGDRGARWWPAMENL